MGVLRRALYESHAMALVEMQKRVEAPSDITQLAVRKLPAAERKDHQRAQEAKLVGVIFTPETRPSHWLVDTFVEMLEQNTLIYLRPDQCRPQEMQSVKRDPQVQLDASGALKLHAKTNESSCPVTTHFDLLSAWKRRSLAPAWQAFKR